MSTQLELALSSCRVTLWQIRQVVMLDWYDGPRRGLCEMAFPKCVFYFVLFAERHSDDDLDDRLFRLSEAPPYSVDQIMTILSELGKPKVPIWIPRWEFCDLASKQHAERQVEMLYRTFKETGIIIQTRDMEHFLGYWQLV